MQQPKPYKRSGSSYYWLRTTVGGREVRESTGCTNLREAEQYIKRRIAELRGDQKGTRSLTFEEAVSRFFDNVELAPETMQQYRVAARRWWSFLGENMPLDEVDRSLLKAFVQVRKKEVKDATIKRNLAFLSTLITYMQDMYDDAPEVNPVVMFSKRKLKEDKRLRWLTYDEVERLAACCTNPMQQAVVWTAVLTGMRHSELRNLTYGDSHAESGAYLYLGDQEIHVVESKNDEPRVIPLADPAVRTLVGTPRHSQSVHVFWHGNGQPFRSFRNWFEAARHRAGLNDVRFHDLRHTFATWWVRNGGDERHLQRILGHESPQMVQRYAHLGSRDLHPVVGTVVGSGIKRLEDA